MRKTKMILLRQNYQWLLILLLILSFSISLILAHILSKNCSIL